MHHLLLIGRKGKLLISHGSCSAIELESSGNLLSDPPIVAYLLASNFVPCRATASLSPEAANSCKNVLLIFTHSSFLWYNAPFILTELSRTLSFCRPISPGPDSLPYGIGTLSCRLT